jgi:eukaryotic-like serine/threonine-protein kinase
MLDYIGKYRVVRVIGEGGMGRVYEATDPVINRRVAIKTISQSVLQDPDTRARFLREAQAAGQLSHPNLITIHDVGEHEGSPFIVMEYLQGDELSRVISHGQLVLDAKLRLMLEVCQGLAYAHHRGLIHRDIKPANIFITADQQVKILDFGLARGAVSELTQTGRVVGTPSYMAPEQVRGDVVDHRADIFAAGVVLYEVLSGQKAARSQSAAWPSGSGRARDRERSRQPVSAHR